MDNYIPMEKSVEEAQNPFPAPYNNCKIMLVGKNAKFKNINSFVEKYFENETNRFVVYKSVDGATDKTISCVEVFKQKSKNPVYQWTKIEFSKRVVLWKCLVDGPRDIISTVETPTIFIVLSKDAFPGELSCLSMQCSDDRENMFLPLSTSRPHTEAHRKSNAKRKTNEVNKWSKPSVEQRKAEAREKEQLLKEIEKASIK